MLKKKIHYFIFIAIGVVVIFFAIDFPGNKGSSYTMGPGFFPILVSTIFILLSLVGIFKKERRPPVKNWAGQRGFSSNCTVDIKRSTHSICSFCTGDCCSAIRNFYIGCSVND